MGGAACCGKPQAACLQRQSPFLVEGNTPDHWRAQTLPACTAHHSTPQRSAPGVLDRQLRLVVHAGQAARPACAHRHHAQLLDQRQLGDCLHALAVRREAGVGTVRKGRSAGMDKLSGAESPPHV